MKIQSKYKYVGKSKVFFINRNDILILDALMNDGSQMKYSHPLNYKYSEHGGLLDFDKKGLDRIIVTTKKESDKQDPDIFFPVVADDAEDYEFMYHTHPPTPFPGARTKTGVVFEIPSLPDIKTFIFTYMEGKTQGSIIVAPEGIYVIRSLKKKLSPDNYKLEDMINEMMYHNYKLAEKFNFTMTPELFYKKVVTNNKFPKKVKEIIEKYTNNELTIDFFKRKKDISGNWTINKLLLIVKPKEKI